jgi:L-fucose dehydrogenase
MRAPVNFADMTAKVVIITGGSTGIGAGCAAVFVAAGATVTTFSRGRDEGERLAAELSEAGPGTCTHVVCDISRPEQLADAIHAVARRAGRLDCLINNAATFTGWLPIDDIDPAIASRVLNTNVLAHFAACRVSLPYLRRTRGVIVNIGSMAGEIGLWHDSIYAASKGAIIGLTRSLAIDEAAAGVRVNAVLPGNIATERRLADEHRSTRGSDLHDFLERLQWLGRSGTVEEVGKAALFLASDMSSFCTGIGLVVSGGEELGMGAKQPYPDFGRLPAWSP